MNQILINITDPSWWFTGVFFVVLGIILTQLIFCWIPMAWRKISKLKPALSRRVYRWKERKVLLVVKKYRQHEVKINWLICRYWSLATTSIIYMIFVVISFILTSNLNELESFDFLKRILSILPIVGPMYIIVIFTIFEKRIVLRTISAHIEWKKRITIKRERHGSDLEP